MGKFLLIFLFTSCIAFAAPIKIKSSDVTFKAVGNPGFLTIEGQGGKLSGLELSKKGNTLKGEVKADLRVFTTDMDLRDRHMHDKYLESKKHPMAKLEFTGVNGHFVGSLTLKGVRKKVAGSYSLKGNKLSARFKLDLTDYPVGVPRWLGITVAEIVEVKVKAEL